MWPSVRASVLSFFSLFEGSVPNMYLDTPQPGPDGQLKPGRVACGIGTDIDSPAAALKLVWRRLDGSVASPDEVTAEWARVHAMQAYAGHGGGKGSVFDRTHTITVDPMSLAQYTAELLAYDESVLRLPAHIGPVYDTIASPAQLARLRTAYASGAGRMWPKLDAAIRAGDWLTAARECWPRDAGPNPLDPTTADHKLTQPPDYRRSYVAVQALYLSAAQYPGAELPPTLPDGHAAPQTGAAEAAVDASTDVVAALRDLASIPINPNAGDES